MSTRYYSCVRCHRRTPAGKLFDAQRAVSSAATGCEACSGTRELHLIFKFGLGAGSAECKVLHAFLPRERVWWEDGGKTVTFFPVPVVVKRTDAEGQPFWLPYWHTVEGAGRKVLKYGQWVPWMDADHFKDLLAQAREKATFANRPS